MPGESRRVAVDFREGGRGPLNQGSRLEAGEGCAGGEAGEGRGERLLECCTNEFVDAFSIDRLSGELRHGLFHDPAHVLDGRGSGLLDDGPDGLGKLLL